MVYLQVNIDIDLLDKLPETSEVEAEFQTKSRQDDQRIDAFSEFLKLVEQVQWTEENAHFHMKSGNSISVSSGSVNFMPAEDLSPEHFFSNMVEIVQLANAYQDERDSIVSDREGFVEKYGDSESSESLWSLINYEPRFESEAYYIAELMGLDVLNRPADFSSVSEDIAPEFKALIDKKWQELQSKVHAPEFQKTLEDAGIETPNNLLAAPALP